jgi:alkylation response protein AidB-like acyl-CoA dehydrogenase
MDLGWSKEQTELRDAAAELGPRTLNEGLSERDRRGEFHAAGWKQLAEFGIQGLSIPREYGGMGLDALTTVGVLESLGYGCKDNGLLFSANAHMWTAAVPILSFGTEEQKRRFLPGLCDGSLIGGNAMSEPESGSDAFGLRTTAEHRGDRYVLRGSKVFVTNGPVADLVVVYATVDASRGARGVTAFVVERGSPGFQVSRSMEKMGLRSSPMAELFFDDCEIPEENRLGKEGAGSSLFTHSLTWERGCILSSGVGTMQRLLEMSIDYARTRKQFGQAIGKFQLVASRIVDMRLRVESARALLYKAAWLRSQGRSVFLEAAMAKLHVSELWLATAQDALRIHGGYGYMQDLELERELRDATAGVLYSGTSEVQRLIIAPLLGL